MGGVRILPILLLDGQDRDGIVQHEGNVVHIGDEGVIQYEGVEIALCRPILQNVTLLDHEQNVGRGRGGHGCIHIARGRMKIETLQVLSRIGIELPSRQHHTVGDILCGGCHYIGNHTQSASPVRVDVIHIEVARVDIFDPVVYDVGRTGVALDIVIGGHWLKFTNFLFDQILSLLLRI